MMKGGSSSREQELFVNVLFPPSSYIYGFAIFLSIHRPKVNSHACPLRLLGEFTCFIDNGSTFR